jgi:hypothetical protein
MDEPLISVNRRQLLIGLGLLAVLLSLGVGGYLVGHSTGEDLDAARQQGTEQGQREGAARGGEEGFAAGRKEGREAAYTKSYTRSYQEAYRSAYENAGLDPPEDITAPKPGE